MLSLVSHGIELGLRVDFDGHSLGNYQLSQLVLFRGLCWLGVASVCFRRRPAVAPPLYHCTQNVPVRHDGVTLAGIVREWHRIVPKGRRIHGI